tara:strand:- start:271 stop:747 length:477 start_codon:yes stop_codon:yes gene_type:complete
MIEWWDKRTQRERGLVSAAAILLALIILLQFIIVPLIAGRSAAALRADQASRTLDVMTSRGLSPSAANGVQAGPTPDADTSRRAILEAANRRGLAIARIQVSTDGVITVQIDDTSAENIFAWLFDLRNTALLEASRATMNDTGSGLVRSSFEFGGKQG